MRVYDNGIYRDATPEEIEEWEKQDALPHVQTDSERINVLESAIRRGMML